MDFMFVELLFVKRTNVISLFIYIKIFLINLSYFVNN